jgi:two-component SAPR family response regulator
MKLLKCIGIDDEQHCNDYLKACCQHISFVKLIGTFTDPFAAFPLIRSGEIDLIFLDFNMAGINAPEFMEKIPEGIQIIMISAEMENTIRAYGMALTAILPKPTRVTGYQQPANSL